MLLTEVFQSYLEKENTPVIANPVLSIPIRLIQVTRELKSSIDSAKLNKIKILAGMLRKGNIKDTVPITVKRHGKKYILIRGAVRILMYQLAGIRAIPAEILPDDVVTEERQRYIVYINDKPTVYFDNKKDADIQANIFRKKSDAKVEVKLGMVN